MTSNASSFRCPTCKSAHIARVLMGMPAFDKKLEKDLEDGKVILGGCLVDDSEPDYYCNDCKHQWRRDGMKVLYPIEDEGDWLKEAMKD